MLNKKNFFNNCSFNSREFKKNLQKTKITFNEFKYDLEKFKIPMLLSYKKEYELDFNTKILKKFLKYKNIIIIGMGGSILGTKSIYSFLKKKIKKEVFFFDNLDSNLHLEFQKIKNLKNSCFLVVSKSGNTLETITNLSILFPKISLKNKLVFITEISDNILMDLANKYNAEIIEHKEYIGGRYSVLSEVGMFPAALMGLNVAKFKNLDNLINNQQFISTLIQNVTSIYTLGKHRIKNSIILSYDSSLNDLGYWYQQLVGESLGKKGSGFTPMMSFAPKDHHSLMQLYLEGPKDKFFTFFNISKNKKQNKISKKIQLSEIKFLKNKDLNFILQAQYLATQNVFKSKRIPFRYFSFNKINEEEQGTIFTFFVLETILLSRLMNVNPFNQPAVEQIKVETKKFLS